jgi:serine phosphatase RsbU (regulator of sigma subunit)
MPNPKRDSSVEGKRATASARAPAVSPGRTGRVTKDQRTASGGGTARAGKTASSASGSSDRQGPRADNRTNTQGNRPVRGGGGGGRGTTLNLFWKFMLVMVGLTVVVMGMLGLVLGQTASTYLFSQKQHDGIEVARMAAQVYALVAERLVQYDRDHPDEMDNQKVQEGRQKIIDDIGKYLANAVHWPGNDSASDVFAVQLDSPGATNGLAKMAGTGTGEEDNGTQVGPAFHQLFLPKSGQTINLPESMEVYSGTKHTNNGDVTIYRFKIHLDDLVFGEERQDAGGREITHKESFGPGANLRVDVNAAGVDNVRSNLIFRITASVIFAIIVVVGVAYWLASTITRPVKMLLKDMQAVARGDLDHHTKPHSTDEIGILAVEFDRMTGNLKEAQSALVEQEKAEYELSIAREVQKQLLPADPPLITGFDCFAFYQGAKAVSGDYYDFIPLGGGLWGFIVADVSGKGIPGSMVMAVTRTIVRLIANTHQNRAADTLKETNRLIAKQIKRGMFVTSFYAILDERTGVLTYASAGHNPMVIYRAATKTCELASAKGIALGFNEGPIFDRTIEEHRTQLQAGDTFLLYTDGFPEAMNADNAEFGEEHFVDIIAKNGGLDARTLTDRLVAAVAKHRGEAEQSDDLTLITVRRA